MNENNLRELFPSSERIAIGARDTNTVERYQNTLLLVMASNPSGSLQGLGNQRRRVS